MLQAPFTVLLFMEAARQKWWSNAGFRGAGMGDDDRDPKLNDLDERLSQARRKAQGDVVEDNPSPMGRAFRMGIDLVVGAGVGLVVGINLDGWLETSPLFMILFLLLGFAAGIRNVIREALKMQAEAEGGQHEKDRADKAD